MEWHEPGNNCPGGRLMKLLEQYLVVVGNHLPLRGKKDILKELRTLLLDEIEEKFGMNPSEEDLGNALKQFGSPREVARRYKGETQIIASNLEDAYFFILKVMAFGISIGFTVTLIINMLGNSFTDLSPIKILFDFLLKTVTAIISGTGALTLVFIGLSRFPCINAKDLDFEEWTPAELKGVELDNPLPSRIECLFTVLANILLVVFANLLPDLVSMIESKVHYTGIVLGHTVNVSRLLIYIRIASVFWILEAGAYAYLYFRQKKSIAVIATEIILKIATPILSLVLFLDSSLYQSYTGIIGVRLLFLIGAIGGTIALVKYAVTEIKRKIE